MQRTSHVDVGDIRCRIHTAPLVSPRALRAAIKLRDRESEPSRVWIFGSRQRGTTWVRLASGCHRPVRLTYGDHTFSIFGKKSEFKRYQKSYLLFPELKERKRVYMEKHHEHVLLLY